MWEPQLEALRDYDVVTPRLYGRGSTVDGYAASVLEDLEGDLVAVGASLGGYTALAMAHREPARIRALGLIDARADADSPERRASRADTKALIENGGAEALWENQRTRLLLEAADEDAVARAGSRRCRGSSRGRARRRRSRRAGGTPARPRDRSGR